MNDYYEKCSCCGSEISMLAKDRVGYVYKFLDSKGKYKYQCSYTCYRKEKARLETEKELKYQKREELKNKECKKEC